MITRPVGSLGHWPLGRWKSNRAHGLASLKIHTVRALGLWQNVSAESPVHLNQCWFIVIKTLRNELQWNVQIVFRVNLLENVICKTSTILSRGQRVTPFCEKILFIVWGIRRVHVFNITFQNIKKLLKIPYTKSPVSMMVHRVGNTLLLDDFDTHKHLLRRQQEDWTWLRRFYYDTILQHDNKVGLRLRVVWF